MKSIVSMKASMFVCRVDEIKLFLKKLLWQNIKKLLLHPINLSHVTQKTNKWKSNETYTCRS